MRIHSNQVRWHPLWFIMAVFKWRRRSTSDKSWEQKHQEGWSYNIQLHRELQGSSPLVVSLLSSSTVGVTVLNPTIGVHNTSLVQVTKDLYSNRSYITPGMESQLLHSLAGLVQKIGQDCKVRELHSSRHLDDLPFWYSWIHMMGNHLKYWIKDRRD